MVHGAKKAKLLYGVAAGVISAGSPVLEKQHFEKKTTWCRGGRGCKGRHLQLHHNPTGAEYSQNGYQRFGRFLQKQCGMQAMHASMGQKTQKNL